MGLKIGQLSQLTDMSVESIRFYEKEKILNPKRTKGSTYRTYDVWDVFELNEAIRYRNMGFSLKEIKDMMQKDDLSEIDRKITERYRDIESKIEYQHMLIRCMASIHEKISSAPYNIGNYWIKKEEEYYYLPYCTRENDTYSDVDYSSETMKLWLSKAPFYTTFLHSDLESIQQDLNQDMWSIAFDKETFDFLNLKRNEEIHHLPSGICLHTIIDMGEKGDLKIGMLKPAMDYIADHGYTIHGKIIGEILIKSHEGSTWQRYMEIKIPVKL